jgi:hypothetical protein
MIAILDSGSSFIALPQDIFDWLLFDVLGPDFSCQYGAQYNKIYCPDPKNLPPLKFALSLGLFTLNPGTYNRGSWLDIVSIADKNEVILGLPFFENYTTILDASSLEMGFKS